VQPASTTVIRTNSNGKRGSLRIDSA
jgi:hypothetical protein